MKKTFACALRIAARAFPGRGSLIHKPRLAIVDVELGGMNGFDVAQRICDIDGGTSIIFITGYEDAVKGKVGEGLTVAGIVEKPFDVTKFLTLVRNVLDRGVRPA